MYKIVHDTHGDQSRESNATFSLGKFRCMHKNAHAAYGRTFRLLARRGQGRRLHGLSLPATVERNPKLLTQANVNTNLPGMPFTVAETQRQGKLPCPRHGHSAPGQACTKLPLKTFTAPM